LQDKDLNWQIMSDDFIQPESESASRGRAYAGRQERGEAHSFTTTHWSVVLAAGDAQSPQSAEALESLCRTYWYPLYAYARRKNLSPEDAQDATQGFFEFFLRNNSFALADPNRGKFRSFLLGSLEHYLLDQWKRAKAQKRGGGLPIISIDGMTAEARYKSEPVETMDPAKLYDITWVGALLARVMSRLRASFEAEGKLTRFEHLKPFLLGEEDGGYTEAAKRLGLSVETARVAVHRMREEFRKVFREEIANTVATPSEIDTEIGYVMSLLSA
jgi:DNA-directed RNA polymerase specialized sigma24 family protein